MAELCWWRVMTSIEGKSCTMSIIRQDEGSCLCHAETNGAGCPGADGCRCIAADGISRRCRCAAGEGFFADLGEWIGTERRAGRGGADCARGADKPCD